MLSNLVLEKIFSHPFVQQFSIGVQSDMASMIQDILKEIEEGNPYATINELFEPTDFCSSADVPELQFSAATAEPIY